MNIQVSMIPDYFNSYIKIPDIQREDTAWTLDQKQMLIDSLYNDYDIPKIYLRNSINENNQIVWWLIDGQQRLTAICEFLANEFPLGTATSLPESMRGKYFNTNKEGNNILKQGLDVQEKANIVTRTLDVVLLTCTDDEEEDMFLRLNKGTPLSAAEKRNAMRGQMRLAVKALAKHNFFKNKVNFSARRYAIDAVCAQLTLLTIKGGPTDAKGKQLKDMYEKNKIYN
ncbi:DUF262 domain-containing protein, partial [Pontibacter sp. BAB1700]|uniref:DUF262 domain-containing protein n=1 Tax=Pontibacter sp. BAB1700 TaxID=1144253 RepID=UPI00178C24E8